MSIATARITVEEFCRTAPPESGYHELRDGEVVFLTYPKFRHERLQKRIAKLLEFSLGSEWDVVIEKTFQIGNRNLRRADVGAVPVDRADDTDLDGYLQGAPDLVVEVLSPGNSTPEMDDKKLLCLKNGCVEFWVLDGDTSSVEVTGRDLIPRRFQAGEVASSLARGVRVSEIFT